MLHSSRRSGRRPHVAGVLPAGLHCRAVCSRPQSQSLHCRQSKSARPAACLLCLPAWPVLCCCAAAAPLQADPPEFTKIPPDDIVGVTVILLTCSYKNQVGVRVSGWVRCVGHRVSACMRELGWVRVVASPAKLACPVPSFAGLPRACLSRRALHAAVPYSPPPAPQPVPRPVPAFTAPPQEFIRVGYYVNNEYTEDELRDNPPDAPLIDRWGSWLAPVLSPGCSISMPMAMAID